MRVLAAVAGVCLLLVATPRIAAACSKRHQPLFELADLARDVAVVKVGAVPAARDAGNVTLRVTTALKGAPRRQLVARETNSSCHTGFRRGKTALVFLGADRWAVGAFEGYVERPAPIVLDTVAAWLAATTDAERAELLTRAIAGADRTLRVDAAMQLADHPALIAALSAEATARLVATLAAAPDDATTDTVRLVLLRAHGAQWRQLAAAPPAPARGELGVAALARHDLEAITDPAVLADRIAGGHGEHDLERVAATERCERVRGVRLGYFTSYSRGRSDHGWKLLADACRTGTPMPY